MQALLSGPSVAEADAGVHSLVRTAPAARLSIADGTATVDLKPAVRDPAAHPVGTGCGWPRWPYTLTQFASVDRVVLEVKGHVVSDADRRRSAGATADDAKDLRRAVASDPVWNPAIGSHLADAVRVTGTGTCSRPAAHPHRQPEGRS